jgi:hypothetical protein
VKARLPDSQPSLHSLPRGGPIGLNKEWNLITHTLVPIIYTEFPAYQTGLGNVQFTGFFSLARPSKFIWGVGPVLQFPTHTDTYLGSDKWGARPLGRVIISI